MIPHPSCSPPWSRHSLTCAIFADSLRSDKRYITSFQVAGFNNQLIGAIHLLELAFLLQQPPYALPHVVVLPPITPHGGHLGLAGTGRSVEPYPIGEIFDLRAFEGETGIAVVEWRDVKKLENVNAPGYFKEDVACWSPHMTQVRWSSGVDSALR